MKYKKYARVFVNLRNKGEFVCWIWNFAQLAIAYSKLTIETLEQSEKYVQS